MIFALWWACRAPVGPDLDAPLRDPSAEWGALLSSAVDGRGRVDYDALAADRSVLDRYVAWLGRPGAVPVKQRGQTALWLNAYNAFVLWSALDAGRPASVRDVPSRWFGPPGAGFFVERAFALGRERVSLWDLEHERLRDRTQDYRVHAALNCASWSCPPLRAELYVGERLDAQLADQMRGWVNDPERGVSLDGGEVVFSPLFDWYARDFLVWTQAPDLCAVAARHADASLAQALKERSAAGCPHRFSAYDWRLNDVSPP